MKNTMKALALVLSLFSFSVIAHAEEPPPIAAGTKMKCPVSGEDFTVGAKTKQVVKNGKRYAFCCPDCQPEFEKNPAKYTK
jgi:YHS domain-containing protein